MKIVLANDAELLRLLERSALTRQDVDWITASDPLDLLDRVTATLPDLVLLGRRVGATSGVELCRRLKADPSTAGVPLVLLDVADPGAPADVCLPPPVDRKTLLLAIGELLAIAQRATERVPARLRVEYSGERGDGVGVIKDLSTGGTFVRTAEALEPGTELQLFFDLPGEPRATVRARAQVMRRVASDPDSHLVAGVGLRFRRMSDRDRDEIRQFVHRGGARRIE